MTISIPREKVPLLATVEGVLPGITPIRGPIGGRTGPRCVTNFV